MGRCLIAIVALLFFAHVTLAQPEKTAAPIDVWFDVDPANGIGEIDDGLMLIQGFHSPEVKIHGVSVVFGNAEFKNALPIGYNIVEAFGPEGLTVYPGAASAAEFGKETEAVTAMAAALRERPLTILAVGPVTNVGTLVQKHPELHERIERIVMVAARRPGQRFEVRPGQARPFRDFNFELDPAAMQAILDTRIPLVFAPWEVSSKVWVTRADVDALRKAGATGVYIHATSQHWLQRWETNLQAPGFNPFDTLALAWVTHPHLIEAAPVSVRIEDGPDDQPANAGQTKPYLLVEEIASNDGGGRSILYCHTPKPEFHALLMQRLGGE